METSRTKEKASSLRWKILRRALLPRTSQPNPQDESETSRISRRTTHGFNLIPCHEVRVNADDECDSNKRNGSTMDMRVCYTLPVPGSPQLFLTQRVENHAQLSDFEICNRYNIDNTGLVCNWPSEDVLAHFCLSQPDIFRSKKVIELGSGYGLAGFVIAAVTEASEILSVTSKPTLEHLGIQL
ncbi:hypothetical protein PIB30_023021 [Stylosanthes scabra]|uniref:Calmodulin-lysine N-methyltransferase n=1 Tax=Stylosanthes scabra TaxID=79078 RepID=A0ABU6V8A4_9FABA|nr:hypothetical protein [Stylosanthes scabra]